MSVYFIVTYDVVDKALYKKYNPGSSDVIGSTVAKHDGKIIVATSECVQISGPQSDMKVIIEFPSKESALAWHDDPEYAPAKEIRLASTNNVNAMIIDKL